MMTLPTPEALNKIFGKAVFSDVYKLFPGSPVTLALKHGVDPEHIKSTLLKCLPEEKAECQKHLSISTEYLPCIKISEVFHEELFRALYKENNIQYTVASKENVSDDRETKLEIYSESCRITEIIEYHYVTSRSVLTYPYQSSNTPYYAKIVPKDNYAIIFDSAEARQAAENFLKSNGVTWRESNAKVIAFTSESRNEFQNACSLLADEWQIPKSGLKAFFEKTHLKANDKLSAIINSGVPAKKPSRVPTPPLSQACLDKWYTKALLDFKEQFESIPEPSNKLAALKYFITAINSPSIRISLILQHEETKLIFKNIIDAILIAADTISLHPIALFLQLIHSCPRASNNYYERELTHFFLSTSGYQAHLFQNIAPTASLTFEMLINFLDAVQCYSNEVNTNNTIKAFKKFIQENINCVIAAAACKYLPALYVLIELASGLIQRDESIEGSLGITKEMVAQYLANSGHFYNPLQLTERFVTLARAFPAHRELLAEFIEPNTLLMMIRNDKATKPDLIFAVLDVFPQLKEPFLHALQTLTFDQTFRQKMSGNCSLEVLAKFATEFPELNEWLFELLTTDDSAWLLRLLQEKTDSRPLYRYPSNNFAKITTLFNDDKKDFFYHFLCTHISTIITFDDTAECSRAFMVLAKIFSTYCITAAMEPATLCKLIARCLKWPKKVTNTNDRKNIYHAFIQLLETRALTTDTLSLRTFLAIFGNLAKSADEEARLLPLMEPFFYHAAFTGYYPDFDNATQFLKTNKASANSDGLFQSLLQGAADAYQADPEKTATLIKLTNQFPAYYPKIVAFLNSHETTKTAIKLLEEVKPKTMTASKAKSSTAAFFRDKTNIAGGDEVNRPYQPSPP